MLYHLQNNEAHVHDNSSFGKNWQIMHLIWEQLARTTIAKNGKQPQHQHKKGNNQTKEKRKKSAQQIKRMLHNAPEPVWNAIDTQNTTKAKKSWCKLLRKSSYLHTIPYRQAMDQDTLKQLHNSTIGLNKPSKPTKILALMC